ncbi:hypothetical protein RDABS01_007051 [Bienertia sinuspersici]
MGVVLIQANSSWFTEYMENNDLGRALFNEGPNTGQLRLHWPTRRRICVGIARGLAFLHDESTIKILMDSKLGTDYDEEEASTIIQVALLCINPSPALRPTMSKVLSMLEGKTKVEELVLEPNSSYGHEWMYRASKRFENQITETETQSLIHSSCAPTGELSSCTSVQYDLYPVIVIDPVEEASLDNHERRAP